MFSIWTFYYTLPSLPDSTQSPYALRWTKQFLPLPWNHTWNPITVAEECVLNPNILCDLIYFSLSTQHISVCTLHEWEEEREIERDTCRYSHTIHTRNLCRCCYLSIKHTDYLGCNPIQAYNCVVRTAYISGGDHLSVISIHGHLTGTPTTITGDQETTEPRNTDPWLADNQSRDLNNELRLAVYLIRPEMLLWHNTEA